MVQNSRYLKIGPGGRRCNCCFPAPSSKDRRAQFRSAKRKAEHEAMRNAEEDMVDQWAMLQEAVAADYEAAYGDYGSPFDDYYSDWKDEQLQIEDEYTGNDYDDYYEHDDIGYFDDEYYAPLQSEQEKVARALSVALMGDDVDWRQHLTHARDFMAAMKRNV